MQEEDGKDDDDVEDAEDAAHVTHLKHTWSGTQPAICVMTNLPPC